MQRNAETWMVLEYGLSCTLGLDSVGHLNSVVLVVHCNDSDRVAVLFLKDCVSFLFMCQWSWRGSSFGKSNINIRGQAFPVCLFHLLQMKGAVFAEGGYSSMALALFRLLPTCLHLQQKKQVLFLQTVPYS